METTPSCLLLERRIRSEITYLNRLITTCEAADQMGGWSSYLSNLLDAVRFSRAKPYASSRHLSVGVSLRDDIRLKLRSAAQRYARPDETDHTPSPTVATASAPTSLSHDQTLETKYSG